MRRYEYSFFAVSILIALTGVIACQREEVPSPSEEAGERALLGLERDLAERIPVGAGLPAEGHPGKFTRVYGVPATFLGSAPGGGGGAAAPDPFAAPSSESGESLLRNTGQSVLEAYGVSEPGLAGAHFNPETNELTVTATPDQHDLVEAIMASLQASMEKNIDVRVEIFQLPSAHALKLERSTKDEGDHTPEWQAVLDLVEKGGARFVTSASVQSRSGTRSKVEAADERVHIEGYGWSNPETKKRLVPNFETRSVGVSLEIDPVLGPDDRTIDLNLDLEYHTAPPTVKRERVRFPEAEGEAEVEVVEFHRFKHTGPITLLTGQSRLLGAWRPTGRPEFESADVMQVAFVIVHVQPLVKVGRIR